MMHNNNNTSARWMALALTTAALTMLPFEGGGICRGCSMADRLSYPLFHANALHALCNAWCLLSLVFFYRMSVAHMIAACIIAVAVPEFALSAAPAVGMSGVCFALMGLAVPLVARKMYFVSWCAVFIAVGIVLPGLAWAIHLWCFSAGAAVGHVMIWIRKYAK